jgi:hypothetical protein
MLFGILIVLIAAGIALYINKSKISEVIHEAEHTAEEVIDKVEHAVAPAIEEVKEVVAKAAEVAPDNKIVKDTNTAVGTVVAAIEAKHAKKRGPKPGNKAHTVHPQAKTPKQVKDNLKAKNKK